MYKEPMASRDTAFYREIINDEMYSLLNKNMCVVVDLPRIGRKWVLEGNVIHMHH